jgi:copper chaperone CopZ
MLMQSKLSICAVAFAAVLAMPMAVVCHADDTATAPAKIGEKVTLKVAGMTWSVNCPKAVVTAFKRAPGVSDATADCHKGEAVVTYDPKVTTPEKLTEALKGTKYTASLPK